ncbi:hypothetical protein E8L99_20775 [Phreatobacter aquaticus]|uniref:Uncharacterized protein n=1 Tax=Phreatobacter aquaticus TaxID=2570229 RepID=A0A4D7QPW6_9HYPH|nr:hypothetical protein [Phreatobacter aquaticus]QCK88013.1 hypothetical protein E8L99_20775 [Phreatobacter aquaticus]
MSEAVPASGWRTALGRCAVALVALVLLGSCAYVPVAVEGVQIRAPGPDQGDSPWLFVPVGAWITRDAVTPIAVGMCEGAACPSKIAVAVVEVRGAEARALSRTLANPSILVRSIEAGNRRRRALVATSNRGVPAAIAARRMPLRVTASSRVLRHRQASGFVLTIRRAEGQARAAHAAVLARTVRGKLKIVMVIGERPASVEMAAKAAAEANL